MQTDGPETTRQTAQPFLCPFPLPLEMPIVFSRRKKIRCGAVGGSVSSRPDFPQSVAATDCRIEQTVLSAKQKASETNDTGLSFPQAAREGKEEAGQAEDSAKGILRQDIIASGGKTSEIFFTAKVPARRSPGRSQIPGGNSRSPVSATRELSGRNYPLQKPGP
jgi:hypothetical protein